MLALLVFALPASAARLPIVASRDWWPVFSPDAGSIAFTRVNGQGRVFTLEVVPAKGGPVVQLARASSQLMPSWSPDSTHVAYQAAGRIWIVTRNGSDRGSVAAGLFPDWSPDGASVAYVQNGSLRVTSKVLASHVIWKPDWSPDGSEIAFARSGGIYAVTLAGAERQVAATVFEPTSPLWAFDGSKIAYAAGGSVYVVAADGETAPRLVAGPYASLSPLSFAPTGDAVAYTADGHLRTTWLGATPRTEVGTRADTGASYSPGDLNGYLLAYSGMSPACPRHSAIRVGDGPVLGGTCTIAGTPGPDAIEGTSSWGDVILAGAGNDRVHAKDGHSDRVNCGPGRDTVWADRSDRLTACEIIHR